MQINNNCSSSNNNNNNNKYLTHSVRYGIKAIFAQPSMTGLALWQFETAGAKSVRVSNYATVIARKAAVTCDTRKTTISVAVSQIYSARVEKFIPEVSAIFLLPMSNVKTGKLVLLLDK